MYFTPCIANRLTNIPPPFAPHTGYLRPAVYYRPGRIYLPFAPRRGRPRYVCLPIGFPDRTAAPLRTMAAPATAPACPFDACWFTRTIPHTVRHGCCMHLDYYLCQHLTIPDRAFRAIYRFVDLCHRRTVVGGQVVVWCEQIAPVDNHYDLPATDGYYYHSYPPAFMTTPTNPLPRVGITPLFPCTRAVTTRLRHTCCAPPAPFQPWHGFCVWLRATARHCHTAPAAPRRTFCPPHSTITVPTPSRLPHQRRRAFSLRLRCITYATGGRGTLPFPATPPAHPHPHPPPALRWRMYTAYALPWQCYLLQTPDATCCGLYHFARRRQPTTHACRGFVPATHCGNVRGWRVFIPGTFTFTSGSRSACHSTLPLLCTLNAHAFFFHLWARRLGVRSVAARHATGLRLCRWVQDKQVERYLRLLCLTAGCHPLPAFARLVNPTPARLVRFMPWLCCLTYSSIVLPPGSTVGCSRRRAEHRPHHPLPD